LGGEEALRAQLARADIGIERQGQCLLIRAGAFPRLGAPEEGLIEPYAFVNRAVRSLRDPKHDAMHSYNPNLERADTENARKWLARFDLPEDGPVIPWTPQTAPAHSTPTPSLQANPGSICPQAGTWITTALLDTRKLEMQPGDTFPIQDRDRSGNAVIWYLKLPTHQGNSPAPDAVASANTKTTCRVGDICPTSGIWEPSLPKTNRNAPFLASSPNRFHKVKAGSPMPEVYAKFMARETADADNAAITWTLVRAD
jgi:hypothetical protein